VGKTIINHPGWDVYQPPEYWIDFMMWVVFEGFQTMGVPGYPHSWMVSWKIHL
jgi:hypothetical protein